MHIKPEIWNGASATPCLGTPEPRGLQPGLSPWLRRWGGPRLGTGGSNGHVPESLLVPKAALPGQSGHFYHSQCGKQDQSIDLLMQKGRGQVHLLGWAIPPVSWPAPTDD